MSAIDELYTLKGDVKERRDLLMLLLQLRFMIWIIQIIVMAVAPERDATKDPAGRDKLIDYGLTIYREFTMFHNHIQTNSTVKNNGAE